MENPTDSLDLDELLADSLLAKKMKSSSHPKKPKAKEMSGSNAHWLNSSEKTDFERQVENAALRALWKPQAAVAMFSIQFCLSCGSQHTHFQGFFQQQRHDSYRDTERWVPATDSTMLTGLPKHKKVTVHEADSCVLCIASLGYHDPSPTLTEPFHAAWSPRQNHSKYSDQYEYPGGLSRSPKTTPLECG